MDVVLLGHSFIRRMRDDLSPPMFTKHGLDIGHYSSLKAARFSTALRISNHIRGMYTLSNNVNFINDITHSKRLIIRTSPGIVIIDIGSNDLARIDNVNPVKMLELATKITDIATQLSAPVVIINCILPRSVRIASNPKTYLENTIHYNTFLKNICDTSDNLVFHKLRGFTHTWVNDIERRLEVSEWSSDGIHCNTPASRKKYRDSVRHAILSEVARARDNQPR
jgi:hypothetical protein